MLGHRDKIRIESKVKGSGQECPIHTGKVKVKVKGSGVRAPALRGLSTKVDSTFVDFTIPEERVKGEQF